MEPLQRIENAVNHLSDMDSAWWPFLFVRPAERHERMSTLRVFGLALLYGLFAGMAANAAIAWSGEAHRVGVLTFPLCGTLGFFCLHRSTFAYFWNRRADRMTPARAR